MLLNNSTNSSDSHETNLTKYPSFLSSLPYPIIANLAVIPYKSSCGCAGLNSVGFLTLLL